MRFVRSLRFCRLALALAGGRSPPRPPRRKPGSPRRSSPTASGRPRRRAAPTSAGSPSGDFGRRGGLGRQRGGRPRARRGDPEDDREEAAVPRPDARAQGPRRRRRGVRGGGSAGHGGREGRAGSPRRARAGPRRGRRARPPAPPLVHDRLRAVAPRRHDPRRAEIYYLGPGHTQGDLVVVAADDGVLFSGDLAVNGVLPFLRSSDVDPSGWERILPRLAALKIDKLVPGPRRDRAAERDRRHRGLRARGSTRSPRSSCWQACRDGDVRGADPRRRRTRSRT